MTRTRKERIELVAAIIFGRAADGGPEKGWMSKLARALDITEGAVRSTLTKDESPIFDRKLQDLVHAHSVTIIENARLLDELQRELMLANYLSAVADEEKEQGK